MKRIKILSSIMALNLLAMTGCNKQTNNSQQQSESQISNSQDQNISDLNSLGGVSNSESSESSESSPSQDISSSDSESIEPVEITSGPKLRSLTLDDGTLANFDPSIGSYVVNIPAGKPRVPRILAVAESDSASVNVYQAMLPETESEALGKVDVRLGNEQNTYTILFKKDEKAGFAIQCGDVYNFTPKYELEDGEAFKYKSTNPSAIKINAKGQITAMGFTQSPVTISALVNGVVKDSITIDRIDRAPLNVFLIVGQSNAEGVYDPNVTDWNVEAQKSIRPKSGTAMCMDVDSNGNQSNIFDLSGGRRGFSSSLAARWYDLTGEKSISIQSAVGGSPIECWEKNGCGYYGSKNLYNNTLDAYNRIKEMYGSADSPYEIIRTGYFWCQGETAQYNTWIKESESWMMPGDYIMPSDVYYQKFMANHQNFVNDMNVEFGSIALVRALKEVCSRDSVKQTLLTDLVPARAAQYTIHNTTDISLGIRSRVGDIARMASAPDKLSPGYDFVGSDNVHYNQIGYNAQGTELADNTFGALSATTDRTPQSLEVIASDGRTRLKENDEVIADGNKGYQLAAMVLPMYTDQPKLGYEIIEGNDKCSVDVFGKVSFNSNASKGDKVKVKVVAECGLTQTVVLEVGQINPSEIKSDKAEFTWNFDDLSEKDGKSNLTLSSMAQGHSYSIKDGKLITSDSDTDFSLDTPFMLNNTSDWSIEWRGKINNNSCLFGSSASNNNFIYLAYDVQPWANPFRVVSNEGQAVHIPYGNYALKNNEMNTWKVEYKQNGQKMTLYFFNSSTNNWETVGSSVWQGKYEIFITNLFGRYGDPSVSVCYNGEIDYIIVNALVEK